MSGKALIGSIVWGYPGRMVAYAVLTLIVGQWIYGQMQVDDPTAVGRENGPIEMMQVVAAIAAMVAFFVAAYRSHYGKAGLVLCGAMAGYAAGRECDSWFEAALFDDAYKYVVGLPMLAIAVAAGWKYRKTVLIDTLRLSRTPAITMFGIAGVYICVVCQIFDRPGFWVAIADHPAVMPTRALVEEFAEVFGYLMIAIAGGEAIIETLPEASAGETSVLQMDRSSEPVSHQRAA